MRCINRIIKSVTISLGSRFHEIINQNHNVSLLLILWYITQQPKYQIVAYFMIFYIRTWFHQILHQNCNFMGANLMRYYTLTKRFVEFTPHQKGRLHPKDTVDSGGPSSESEQLSLCLQSTRSSQALSPIDNISEQGNFGLLHYSDFFCIYNKCFSVEFINAVSFPFERTSLNLKKSQLYACACQDVFSFSIRGY